MKNTFQAIFTFVILISLISGCTTIQEPKSSPQVAVQNDTIKSIEMHFSENIPGGNNKDINIDVVKGTGFITETTSGLAPEYYDNIVPSALPEETVKAIINHLNVNDLNKLKKDYIGELNNDYYSSIKVTTNNKTYNISVTGNSGNDFIRKLHTLAYGREF